MGDKNTSEAGRYGDLLNRIRKLEQIVSGELKPVPFEEQLKTWQLERNEIVKRRNRGQFLEGDTYVLAFLEQRIGEIMYHIRNQEKIK